MNCFQKPKTRKNILQAMVWKTCGTLPLWLCSRSLITMYVVVPTSFHFITVRLTLHHCFFYGQKKLSVTEKSHVDACKPEDVSLVPDSWFDKDQIPQSFFLAGQVLFKHPVFVENIIEGHSRKKITSSRRTIREADARRRETASNSLSQTKEVHARKK